MHELYIYIYIYIHTENLTQFPLKFHFQVIDSTTSFFHNLTIKSLHYFSVLSSKTPNNLGIIQ